MTNLTMKTDPTEILIYNSDGTFTPIDIQDFTLSLSDLGGIVGSPSQLAEAYRCLKQTISIPIKGKLNPDWFKLKSIRTPTATYKNLPWPWRLDAYVSQSK